MPEPKAKGLGKGPRSLSVKQLRREAKRELRLNGEPEPLPEVERPKTRGDCFGGERPCPFVGCKYHTYLDVTPAGSLVINRPDVDPTELEASCSLEVADDGGKTLEQVGAVLNLTRERVRQLEERAIVRAEAAFKDGEVRTFRGSCKARCAQTGLRCRLPAHPTNVAHAHERGTFHQVAAEGQTDFVEKRRLEDAARRNPFDDGGTHVRG